MATNVIKTSFAGGELSPQLYGRVDLAKYNVGAEFIRNFHVDYRGGLMYRCGTKFIAACANNTNNGIRLIPFIFNQEQSYVLEFSVGQIRIFLDGALVDSVVGPWDADQIWDIKYVQSADVLTLTHPEFMPHDLSRTSLTTFTLTEQVFGPSIASPTIVSATPSVAGSFRYGYVITALNANGDESLATFPTWADSEPLDPTNATPKVIRIEWDVVSGADRYNIYKVGPVPDTQSMPTVFGYIGQTQANEFTDVNIAGDLSRTPPIFNNPFSPGQITNITVTAGGSGYPDHTEITVSGGGGAGAGGYGIARGGVLKNVILVQGGVGYTSTPTITAGVGTGATFSVTLESLDYYPSAVSYFQQRRVYGGSDNAPQLMEFSQIGNYENFDYSIALLDSDAISAVISSREVNQIQHFVPMATGLIALTTGGAFLVSGGSPTAAVTPTNLVAMPQAGTGAGALPPIVVNYNVLFEQAKGSIVRDMTYSFDTQSYVGSDRSMLSNHLFDGHELRDWGFMEVPHKLLLAVRDDGIMLAMAYVPDQEVYGWSQFDTKGLFKSICVIPEGEINAAYVVVRRYIDGAWANYIERFMCEEFDCVADSWLLDSALGSEEAVGETDITVSGVSGEVTVTGLDLPPNDFSELLGFEATASFNSSSWGNYTCGVDHLGRLWTQFRLGLQCVDTDGTVLASNNIATMATAAADYAIANQLGTTWTVSSGPDTTYKAFVFGDTSYLIGAAMYYQGIVNARFHALTLYEIGADASLTIVGMTWLYAPQYTNLDSNSGVLTTCISGRQGIDDPLYVWAQVNNATQSYGEPFPSISSLIGKCQPVGPYVRQDFTTTGAQYTGTFVSNYPVFTLPGPSGTTLIARYYNIENMAEVNSANYPTWLDALAGTYPNGVLVVANVGVVTAPAFVTTMIGPTTTGLTPAVVPLCFEIDGLYYSSFPDVGKNFDGTGTHTSNDYRREPSVTQVTDDLFQVAWVQPYQSDASYVGGNWNALGRVRLMSYDPDSGAFSQTGVFDGAYATIDQIAAPNSNVPNDTLDVPTCTAFIHDGLLKVWFVGGTSAASSGRDDFWLAHFAEESMGTYCLLIGCAHIEITEVVDGVATGTIEGDLALPFPSWPDGTPIPIDAGEWTYAEPVTSITLAHLVGETVWVIADGTLLGPFVVPEGGVVDLGGTYCRVRAGLQYQGQIRTLRLDVGEPTVQGKRKTIPAVTSRVAATAGLKYGTEADFSRMWASKENPVTVGEVVTLLTGDERVVVDATWAREGYITVQQDYPLPATLLALVPEVNFGDNQR